MAVTNGVGPGILKATCSNELAGGMGMVVVFKSFL